MPGTTVKDVAAHDFVRAYAAFLKRSGKITPPKWAELVKTAVYKELSPYDPDWFYVRCAAIARRVYMKPGVGVGALCKSFGGSRNNGTAPSHHHPATSNIQRKALQALESVKVLQKSTNGGRQVSSTGQQDLDRIACQVAAAK